jgi:hypothetical protein
MTSTEITYPAKGILKKLVYFIKYHFHALLYFYVWFGLFVSGLVAPTARVAALHSSLITSGWHLSLLSTLVVLPWPMIYIIRFRTTVVRKIKK